MLLPVNVYSNSNLSFYIFQFIIGKQYISTVKVTTKYTLHKKKLSAFYNEQSQFICNSTFPVIVLLKRFVEKEEKG